MALARLRIAVALGAVLVLTFLFFKSRTVDLRQHDSFQHHLRKLQEVDSQLNQDLLKLGYSLLTYYDPIVAELSELQSQCNALENVPEYLGEDGVVTFRAALADFNEVVAQKTLLVERLKSANVRLKNSLGFLPVLSNEIANMAPDSPQAREAVSHLKDLLQDVLLYNLSLEQEHIRRVQQHLAALRDGTPRGSMVNDDIRLILRHVETVMKNKPEIISLTRDLISLPTSDLIERLQNTYDRYYQRATMRADSYRAYLYIFSIALLVYIAYIIIKLRQITQELNVANESLEARVLERTRELDRSETRNRALLNAIPDLMLRLDRDGAFLDAKDSVHFPLGSSAEQLAGSHLSEVFPELSQKGLSKIGKALDTGEPQTVNFQTNQNGDSQDFEARIVVSGQNQVLVIVRDVTEQKRAAEKITKAQRRSEELLHNILPEDIAAELKAKGTVDPKYFEDVTILFANFVGFSSSTDELAAEELVYLLHDYFTAFDEITCRYRLEKLKTVGDVYMCVGGLPKRKPSHPVDAVLAACEMIRVAQERDQSDSLVHWAVRIGIHTGPVVAGVVGIQKFAFDVFGQSVNFSSRLESSSEENRINISADTYSRVKDFFACSHRGKVPIGDRDVDMYFVEGVLPPLVDGPQIPPAFLKRYRIYFHRDPPSFPSNVSSTGKLCLTSRSGKGPPGAPGSERGLGI